MEKEYGFPDGIMEKSFSMTLIGNEDISFLLIHQVYSLFENVVIVILFVFSQALLIICKQRNPVNIISRGVL